MRYCLHAHKIKNQNNQNNSLNKTTPKTKLIINMRIISLISSLLFVATVFVSSAESTSLRGPDNERKLMGNPASQYCDDNGGTLESHYDVDGGEWALCTFTNGSACEEWAYSRGECNVGEYLEFTTNCRKNGGKFKGHRVDNTNIDDAGDEFYYTCQGKDGSICFEEDYYNNKC